MSLFSRYINKLSIKLLLIILLLISSVIAVLYYMEQDQIEKQIKSQYLDKGSSLAKSLALSLQNIAEYDIENGVYIDGKFYKGDKLEKLIFNDKLLVIPESLEVAEKRKKDKSYLNQTVTLHDNTKIPLWEYELKYMNENDKYTDTRWQDIIDGYLINESVVFALPTQYSKNSKVSGYIGTHNKVYSPSGDDSKDLWGDKGILSQKYRANRVFNDSTGYNASQYKLNEVNLNKNVHHGVLIQQYPRIIEGKVVNMWDISYPITINEKHWGGVRVAMSQVEAESLINENKQQLLLQLLILSTIIIISLFIFTKFLIGNRIERLERATNKIFANEQIDLGVSLHTNSKDEIGRLSNELEGLIGYLKNIVFSLKDMSKKLKDSSMNINSTTKDTKSFITDIMNNITNINEGTRLQVENVEQGAKAMEEITDGINKVSDSSMAVMESSHKMVQKSEEGHICVNNVISQIEILSQSSINVAQKIETLSVLSNEIHMIASTITNISTQTNILSLNASIEAARAGESGKGFSVIANEIRKLAEQSKNSSTQIQELIEKVSFAIQEAVESMKNGEKEVIKSKEKVNELNASFNEILCSAINVDKEIQEVSAITEQIAAGSEEVCSSMDEISQVSKQSSAKIEEVTIQTKEQFNNIEKISDLSNELNEMFKELEGIIMRFKS